MKTLFNKIINIIRPGGLVSSANDLSIANAIGGSDAVFEVQQDGSFFVPFGKYSHEKGLQIFDKAAAEALQAAANSLLTKAAGIPIYAGHPDVKGRPDSNPAAPAYGWIDGIEIENDGAKFLHRLNKRGQEAVANADFRFYSPHWLLKKVAGGLSPVRLLSMGLTNNPRIPVPAIANDQDHQDKTMTEAQLRAIGLEPGATEDAIDARLAELGSAANDLVTVTARAVQAEADLGAARTEIAAANDRATAARSALVDSALDRAVLSGRITEADRAPRRVELLAIENDSDLTGRLTELEKASPALPGQQTGDLSGAREVAAAENDATARSSKRQQAVEAELTAIANDYPGMPKAARYDMAWQRAQRKHPTLFTAQANA
jgi:hypothetical protein